MPTDGMLNPDIIALLQWRNLFALVIGLTGSLAYFTAVFFGFVAANTESRDYVIEPFAGGKGLKVIWYALFGGFVAAIFQIPQNEFVPVQAFILGATWPSIVSQLLTGRQAGPSADELARETEERRRDLDLDEFEEIEAHEEQVTRRTRNAIEERLSASGGPNTID